jgi:transposase-like protein
MAARDLDKEQYWRQAIEQHAQSGKSVRALCAAKGIPESSFYFWRREIKARDRFMVTVRKNGNPKHDREPLPKQSRVSTKSPLFVPVRVVAKEVARPSVARLEVVLVGGARLKIPAGFDRETLCGVIAMLMPESPRC